MKINYTILLETGVKVTDSIIIIIVFLHTIFIVYVQMLRYTQINLKCEATVI